MIPGSQAFGNSRSSGNTISYIGNAGENTSQNAQTITYNASSLSGDFLILYVQSDNADHSQTITGWTKLLDGASSSTARGTVYYKFMTTDTTVYVPDFGDHTEASVLTFRGVDRTNPINASFGEIDGEAGSHLHLPGVTTTLDNCFILYGVFHDINSSSNSQASNWVNANISSGTEFLDISTSVGWDGGVAVWGGTLVNAGASGTTTMDIGQDKNDYPICCIALTPSQS